MMDIRCCWRASHVSSGLQLLLQAHKIRRLQRRQHPKQVLQHLPGLFLVTLYNWCFTWTISQPKQQIPGEALKLSPKPCWRCPPSRFGLPGSWPCFQQRGGAVQRPRLDIPKGQATSTFWTRFTCKGEQWESCLSSERFADYEPLVPWLIVNLGGRLSNHPLTQSGTQCTGSVHALHILDGSKKNAILLPLCAACLLLATWHSFKIQMFFLHWHSAVLHVRCFFQYIQPWKICGVVTRARAWIYHN